MGFTYQANLHAPSSAIATTPSSTSLSSSSMSSCSSSSSSTSGGLLIATSKSPHVRRPSMSSQRISATTGHHALSDRHQQLSTSPSGGMSSPLLASNGKTRAPSFLYLPPGLAIARNGCGEKAAATNFTFASSSTSSMTNRGTASSLSTSSSSLSPTTTSSLLTVATGNTPNLVDDDAFNNSNLPRITTTSSVVGFEPNSKANDSNPQIPPPSSSSSSSLSRKLSSSSCSSSCSSSVISCCASSGSTSGGPISSLASSVAASDDAPSASASAPAFNSKRALSSSSRPTVPGEDPQLAAARRALWEDVEPVVEPISSETDDDEEGSTTPSTRSYPVFSDDEDVEEDYLSNDEVLETPQDEETTKTTTMEFHAPSHATLQPLSSCLRSEPPSRTPSSQSQSTSSTFPSPINSASSVRISDEPPKAFTTYSAIDYERRGQGPVEKLSIKEWMELQGVREAVGVWSGKITSTSWSEEPLTISNDSEVTSPTSTFSSTTPSTPTTPTSTYSLTTTATTTTPTPTPNKNGNVNEFENGYHYSSPIYAIGKGHPSTASGIRRISSLQNTSSSNFSSSSTSNQSPSITTTTTTTPKRSMSGPLLNDKHDKLLGPLLPFSSNTKISEDASSVDSPLMKPCYMGVRTVTHNVKPVSAPLSLWDD